MTYVDATQTELATVDYLRGLGYEHVYGPDMAADGARPEREDYWQAGCGSIRTCRPASRGHRAFSSFARSVRRRWKWRLCSPSKVAVPASSA